MPDGAANGKSLPTSKALEVVLRPKKSITPEVRLRDTTESQERFMSRTFTHNGESWRVRTTGGSHGVGSAGLGGALPKMTSYSVHFIRASDGTVVDGRLRSSDLQAFTETELIEALERAMAREDDDVRR